MANNIFTSVALPKLSGNVFEMNHDVKMSLNMGKLYPVFCEEALPGDKWNMSSEAMLRFAPLIAPVMHRVNVFMHFFFVPNRILWPGWDDFISGAENPPAHPYFAGIGSGVGSLADYLGLPLVDDGISKVNALPFAAYQKVFNDYYRDQNLVPEVKTSLTDGDNTSSFSADPVADFGYIRTRAWQHDYFTSALPFAQKGDPVTIPLAGDAPVRYNQPSPSGNTQIKFNAEGVDNTATFTPYIPIVSASGIEDNELYADLSATNSVTINDLRFAIKLQEWLERNARGGTRYKESLKVHFDVDSSDKRLDRPEYLGGSMAPMVISEVLQTSQSDATPLGEMAGHGISVSDGRTVNYFCEEHGWIIGIMSVMPVTAYQQGLHRKFSRFDRLDYYWPSFAHLGEQEIKNKEVYYANDGQNEQTFGYTPRYSEYKYLDSRVAGEMRTNLSFWHMGRIFPSRPALNKSFIECNPGTRFFAVEEGADTIYAHIFHKIRAYRKIPRFGIPSI